MRKRIYLDYAASTPVDQKVLKAMLPYLKKEYGNPSSSHSFGQAAGAAIEKARVRVAKFLNCQPLEIIFTSGATEANNLAIRGIIKSEIRNPKSETNSNTKIQNSKPHIITSQIEHESVLSVCEDLQAKGLAEVTYVPVDKEGIVRAEDIEKAIKENTVLVSVMYVNSEIGTVQPITEIGEVIKERNKSLVIGYKSSVLFHTDAVQAAQFLDCNAQKLGVDLLTLSSHKFYGPKGAGALFVKEGVVLDPFMLGGGQEQGFRSGTENVADIVGMGEALALLQEPRTQLFNIKIRQLRDFLIKEILRTIPFTSLTGSRTKRIQNNVHVCFHGVEGQELLMVLDGKGIAISTGSACSEKTHEPSHVLIALGMSSKDAMSCVRFTLGKQTTKEEIVKVLKTLRSALEKLQRPRI